MALPRHTPLLASLRRLFTYELFSLVRFLFLSFFFSLFLTTSSFFSSDLFAHWLGSLVPWVTCGVVVPDASTETFFFFFFAHFYFPASGQAVVTGVVPSPPRFLPSLFIAHRVQHSHCSSICHRVLLTHALALSASQFVHKKKSQRIYTSMHSAGLELTKLTYTRREVNLIRHRGDRLQTYVPVWAWHELRLNSDSILCIFGRMHDLLQL